MTDVDQNELKRLCYLLETIETQNSLSAGQIEAIRKSAFALQLTFLAQLREKLEMLYENPPLTTEEKEKLRAMGIDPETGGPLVSQ